MFPLVGNIKKIVPIECYHFSENVPAFGGENVTIFTAQKKTRPANFDGALISVICSVWQR